eukprot:500931_1
MGNGIPQENVSYTPEGMKIKSLNGQDSILIRSFCVDGRSDRINNYDAEYGGYTGLVLYSSGGRSSWTCNGKSVQSGFILITKGSRISNVRIYDEWNSAHARLYKWYFGVSPDYSKIIGAGFAYGKYQETITNSDGEERKVNRIGWKWNSNTFNAPTKISDHDEKYHDDNRAMNKVEQHWVKKAYDAYKDNNYSRKQVYCNAATWKFRKNSSWIEYNYYDSIAIEKEYEIYKKKRAESDREIFDKSEYYIVRYMNHTKYKIYFNAPHTKEDMFGYTSSDGYQRNDSGCVRAIYRDSNEYQGDTGCIIL